MGIKLIKDNGFMTLTALKNRFISELKGLYNQEEILSFFFILTDHFLKKNRLAVALEPDYRLTPKESSLIQDGLQKLTREIPVQYITGYTEFMGLHLEVNEKVLIPRPETEELVDWIIRDSGRSDKKEILDIGTGSGCIAVSLAKNLPLSKITALDFSQSALETAKANAKKNQVKVNFFLENILETSQLPQPFDIIVSNPPYVREKEKKHMSNNVLKHEPGAALFVSDEEPLVFYDKIAQLAQEHLKDGGSLYFEINQYLGAELRQLIKSLGFKSIEIRQDIYGADRMLRAIKF